MYWTSIFYIYTSSLLYGSLILIKSSFFTSNSRVEITKSYLRTLNIGEEILDFCRALVAICGGSRDKKEPFAWKNCHLAVVKQVSSEENIEFLEFTN